MWTGLRNGSIKIYNTETFTLVHEISAHKTRVYALILVNGNVWSGSEDRGNLIAVWSARDFKPVAMNLSSKV